jgi:uncharacterized protein with HEPN domain
MRREPKAYLWDAHNAAQAIVRFTRDKDYAAFLADDMVRAAVEREFEIIGEALRQLTQVAPEVAAKIPDLRRIIAFRNILVHGYAAIDMPTSGASSSGNWLRYERHSPRY